MTSREDVAYRLRLARGFLDHARRALDGGVFFACADASQRAGEDAAKALISLVEPPAKTHTPADRLSALLDGGVLVVPPDVPRRGLLTALHVLGPELHIEAGYGREDARLAPWDTIDAPRAEAALAAATVAVELAERIVSATRAP